jgi:uncharacterized protein (DUF2236 family)
VFERGDVIRRVDGEAVLLLGGPRAVLMQLAHPSVAAGVADHSDFRNDTFGRLRRTLEVTTTIVFGTEAQASQAAASLRAVHDRVVGDGYRANDPELLLWVHATLVDTALRVHRRFLAPLSAADEARYYEQSTLLAEVIGVPRTLQPADIASFRDYVRTMVGSLEVTDQARDVARSVMHPAVPLATEPFAEVARQITVGLLPPPLRRQFGYTWDRRRAAALSVAAMTSRRVLPLVPSPLRRALAA